MRFLLHSLFPLSFPIIQIHIELPPINALPSSRYIEVNSFNLFLEADNIEFNSTNCKYQVKLHKGSERFLGGQRCIYFVNETVINLFLFLDVSGDPK